MRSVVSVIVPVYNVGNYIGRCIDSILKQDYNELEIILIDDGSTDNSGVICDDYAKTDDRIIVIHTENRGVSSARNEGLKIATGEYVAFIDGDDWVDEKFIGILVDLILTSKSDMAICSMLYCYDKNPQTSFLYTDNYEIFGQKEIFSKILLSEKIGGFLSNKLFKKSLIRTFMNENIHMSEDFVFCAEYLKNITKVAFIDLPLYYYFQRNILDRKKLLRYDNKIFSLLYATENIIDIYTIYNNDLIEILYLNYLKEALNIKGRYLYSNANNKEQLKKINSIIDVYFPIIIKSKHISICEKINLILSKLLPVKMLKIKRKKIRKG